MTDTPLALDLKCEWQLSGSEKMLGRTFGGLFGNAVVAAFMQILRLLAVGLLPGYLSACGGGNTNQSPGTSGNGTPPVITLQPEEKFAIAPNAVSFNVGATGTPTPTVQWQMSTDGGTSFVDIHGATTSAYTTPATYAADNGKLFRAKIVNAIGTSYSNPASLAIYGAVPLPNRARLTSGGTHTCAIREAGTVACWGSNSFGQLGDGTTVGKYYPTTVPGLSQVVSLALGSESTCALKSDQTVTCWGRSNQGQLGNGTYVSQSAPGPVQNLAGVTAISSAGARVCAVLTVGQVHCWGDGTALPTLVAGLANVSAVVVGSSNCAVIVDGTVNCWGGFTGETWGNYDPATHSNHSGPVSGLTGVVSLAAGGNHMCAAKSDGTVDCWGYNSSGVIGNGTTVDQLYPQTVPGLTGVVAVTAGMRHTCASLIDGDVVCWGQNVYGQIGDGGGIDRLQPTSVPLASGAVELHAEAYSHVTCALKSGDALQCWGLNGSGQLGDGTTITRNVPTAVFNWP